MKTTKILIVLAVILITMGTAARKSFGQSYISGSAGADFSTLQVFFGGKLAPIYNDDDKLNIGLSTPITLTGHYAYDPIVSTAINSPGSSTNINLVLTASAVLNLSYRVNDDISFRLGAGYGTLANSEPMSVSFGGNNSPSNEPMDYITFGTHLDVGVQYQKFDLSFANLINYHQAFLTYNLTDAFFAGLGYRQLNQLIVKEGNSFPKSPSTFQVTAGIRWGKGR
jgi:hypothetical protein